MLQQDVMQLLSINEKIKGMPYICYVRSVVVVVLQCEFISEWVDDLVPADRFQQKQQENIHIVLGLCEFCMQNNSRCGDAHLHGARLVGQPPKLYSYRALLVHSYCSGFRHKLYMESLSQFWLQWVSKQCYFCSRIASKTRKQ